MKTRLYLRSRTAHNLNRRTTFLAAALVIASLLSEVPLYANRMGSVAGQQTAALAANAPADLEPVSPELAPGVAAFSSGEYERASEIFAAVARVHPEHAQAQFYLGSTYALQIVPNSQNPENIEMARKAADALNQALMLRPDDGFALRELVQVYWSISERDKARDVLRRILTIAPGDFEAEYQIGVYAWIQAYRTVYTTLSNQPAVMGQPGYPKASPSACRSIAAHNIALLDDAVQHLKSAVTLNPDYEGAFAYLGLVYQLRAGTHCADTAARKADLALYEAAVVQTMHARKRNEDREAGDNVTEVQSPQPPSKFTPLPHMEQMILTAPPPPPPPPPSRVAQHP